MNKRKGISLIVLVITILVMLILSGVVIVSLSKNNPIEKAKEATLKTNVSQLLEDVNLYITTNLDKDFNEKYPIVIGSINQEELTIGLKEEIAKSQGKYLVNGLPDIYSVDYSKIYLVDKNKINTTKYFDDKVILTISEGGSVKLFSQEGIKFKGKIYYLLEELLFELDGKSQYITDEFNTYKLYGDGLLTCVGKKSKFSGATSEELEDMLSDFNAPYISPMQGNDIVKEVIGHDSIFSIRKDGSVWVVGKNNDNKYGLGYDTEILSPTKLNIADVKEVYPGNKATFVVKKDGTLWVVGNNTYGELGVGDKERRDNFTQVLLPQDLTTDDIATIFSSYMGSGIITKDNRIYACGISSIFGGPLDKNGNGVRYNTFTKINLPCANSEIKTICPSIYGVKILTKSGDLYTTNEFAEKVNAIAKKGEFSLVLQNVEQIGEAEADLYFNTYIAAFTNDKKLLIGGAYNKEFREVNCIDLDITNLKMLSSSKYLIDGKVYRIHDPLIASPKLYLHSQKLKNKIVSSNQDFCTEMYTDEKGNKYIVGKYDLVNNIKLVQKEQRKVFGNAKYISARSQNGGINIIDKNYDLWISLKEKSPRKNVVKAFPYSPGVGGQCELLLNGDFYFKNEKILTNIKDVSFNHVYTMYALTKDNKTLWKGWNKYPFATSTPLPEGENIETFQEVTLPGIPQDAEKIYSTLRGVYLLTASGELYSYGYPNYTGFTDVQERFRKIELPDKVVNFNTFSDHETGYSVATLANGDVYAWGSNKKGQFGDGYEIKVYQTPQKLNITNVEYVATGNGFAIYSKKNGEVFGAGRNEYGQLGTGDTNSAVGKFVFSKELSENI